MKNKTSLFLFLITLVLFTISYSTNIFKITDEFYKHFDRADEGNVLGRMVLSQEKGIFYKGGITGQYYDYKYPVSEIESANPPLRYFDNSVYPLSQLYDDYINDRVVYDGHYHPYKSQPGGQAMMYGFLQKISPFSGKLNLGFFRFLTVFLSSLAFALFIGWVYRNYKMLPAIIAFVFLFLSPWLFRFALNLWWALWSFYIPFITMLLVLERRKKYNKQLFNTSLLIYLGIAVFVKFFFTGAEFISSALVAAVSPIIYYLLQDKLLLVKHKFIYFLKSCVAACFGVILGLFQLVVQLRFLEGTWQAAIKHVIFSYTKHNTDSPHMILSFKEMIIYYFNANVFYFPFIPNFHISFGMFAVATFMIIVIFFLMQTTIALKKWESYKGLFITCIISLIGPYSWFLLFPAHAAAHVDFDCIVWYMPFLLFAFCVWGVFIKEIGLKIIRVRL